MDGGQWVTVITAAIAAISAMFAAWISSRNGQRLNTNGGKTIGQHVEALSSRIDALTVGMTKPSPPVEVVPPPEKPIG